MKFVYKGHINNIPSMVEIMAWCQPGDKLFPKPMVTSVVDVYMRHSTSVS